MLLAGISRIYTEDPGPGIAQQWSRLRRQFGKIPHSVRRTSYGVLREAEDQPGSEYVCGVEVFQRAGVEESMSLGLPEDWTYIEVPEQHYAIFRHDGPVSTIRDTWGYIWNEWAPKSGRKVTNGPVVESYEEIDPETKTGMIEIWIPVKER